MSCCFGLMALIMPKRILIFGGSRALRASKPWPAGGEAHQVQRHVSPNERLFLALPTTRRVFCNRMRAEGVAYH